MLRYLRDNPLFSGLFGVIFTAALFLSLMNQAGDRSFLEERSALEQALRRDITMCYALEGAYPPDLSYLEEHYALTWDRSLFYVDYRPVASNIRPYYAVIEVRE